MPKKKRASEGDARAEMRDGNILYTTQNMDGGRVIWFRNMGLGIELKLFTIRYVETERRKPWAVDVILNPGFGVWLGMISPPTESLFFSNIVEAIAWAAESFQKLHDFSRLVDVVTIKG